MPRRPKPEDIDFEIHVDPSCMSAPQDEAEENVAMSARESLSGDGSRQADAIEELEHQIREHLDLALQPETSDAPVEEKGISNDDDADETKAAREPSTTPEEYSPIEGKADAEVNESPEEPSTMMPSSPVEHLEATTDTIDHETSMISTQDEPAENVVQSIETEGQVELDQAEPEQIEPDMEGEATATTATAEDDAANEASAGTGERLHTPDPTERRDSCQSNQSALVSPRRASGRTEALIQAAARNIVAQIEQGHDRHSTGEGDVSFVSETETVERSRVSESYSMTESRRSSAEGVDAEHTRSADEGADSSSHNENEDDVFSDHSPRSSVGSASDAAASDADVHKMGKNVTRRSMARSSRMSGVSGFSQYEEDDFIPTVRGTPRPAFRSPSSVKAIQMSSPPASVFGSPRSSRRTPLPTVSRLGSPGLSAQFSPKKTPPRFKRNTPPLVLLHVTLLPLRWAWGDILDDATNEELSLDGKNLRDAWRQLQDRMGDTTCERGILLPHPQNDYEVLEERLLEALELPMRRRARILECGHYLGPTNEMTMLDDVESDEEFDDDDDANFVVHSAGGKTHWCTTCRSDIRYDSLGAGKVFRVKVYASNGLMKAGAWDTCWKEMERVDVEIEPLVELGVQHELSKLQAEQERRLDEEHAIQLRHSLAQEEEYEQPEDHREDVVEVEEEGIYHHEEPQPEQESTPQHVPDTCVPPASPDEARRLRDEERLREIYGRTPPATHPEPDSPDRSFIAHGSPPSPSVEAFERRQERARASQAYKTASLPELLLESVRVLMQDRKNVVILVMGLLVAFLALKGSAGNPTRDAAKDIERLMEQREATVTIKEVPPVVLQETVVVVDEAAQPSVEVVEVVESPRASVMDESSVDPCSSSQAASISISVSREVVRVIETVTETSIKTATVTQTFTALETESAVKVSSSGASDTPAPAELKPLETTPVDDELQLAVGVHEEADQAKSVEKNREL